MKLNYRKLQIIAIPAVGAGILALALLTNGGADSPITRRSSPIHDSSPVPSPVSRPPSPVSRVASPLPVPTTGSAESVAAASESARIRSTYQNFRTAVATGNATLQEALLPVLKRDLDAALKLAREEIRNASTADDRRIAEKTLESIR